MVLFSFLSSFLFNWHFTLTTHFYCFIKVTTLEISSAIFRNTIHCCELYSTVPLTPDLIHLYIKYCLLPLYSPQISKRYLYPSVYCDIVHNNQPMEPTCILQWISWVGRGMWYIQKRGWDDVFCDSVGRPGLHVE